MRPERFETPDPPWFEVRRVPAARLLQSNFRNMLSRWVRTVDGLMPSRSAASLLLSPRLTLSTSISRGDNIAPDSVLPGIVTCGRGGPCKCVDNTSIQSTQYHFLAEVLHHETQDHHEALDALLEKRPPQFTGR